MHYTFVIIFVFNNREIFKLINTNFYVFKKYQKNFFFSYE